MITSITTVAGAGSVNICLPIRLRPGDRLKAVAAADLTTALNFVGLYLAPAKFTAITQTAEMPTDTLSECCALEVRTQTALADRVTWSGDIEIDAWAPVVMAVFVNCTASDRLQVAVNVESYRAK